MKFEERVRDVNQVLQRHYYTANISTRSFIFYLHFVSCSILKQFCDLYPINLVKICKEKCWAWTLTQPRVKDKTFLIKNDRNKILINRTLGFRLSIPYYFSSPSRLLPFILSYFFSYFHFLPFLSLCFVFPFFSLLSSIIVLKCFTLDGIAFLSRQKRALITNICEERKIAIPNKIRDVLTRSWLLRGL